MQIPRDFEYIVRRPGNPITHSLGNGSPAHPNAAPGAMKLASEWLKEVPFVGIEIARFKIFIIISSDGTKPNLDSFPARASERMKDYTIVHETPQYLTQILEACPEYEMETVS